MPVQQQSHSYRQSSGSKENSHIFSLSSNESIENSLNNEEMEQSDQFSSHLCASSQQFQNFKSKLLRLFNLQSQAVPIQCDDLDYLFQQIQQKTLTNFTATKIEEFDSMLKSLLSVRQNNRKMAQLVSLLAIKLNSSRHSAAMETANKAKRVGQLSPDASQITTLESESKNESLSINGSFAAQKDSELYHYEPRPIDPLHSPQGKNDGNVSQEATGSDKYNPLQDQSNKENSYYEQFKQRNKQYEEKVRSMCQELTSIRKELQSTSQRQKWQSNSIKSPQHSSYTTQVQNKIPSVPLDSQKRLNEPERANLRFYQKEPNPSNFDSNDISKSSQNEKESQENESLPSGSRRMVRTSLDQQHLKQYARNISKKLSFIKEQIQQENSETYRDRVSVENPGEKRPISELSIEESEEVIQANHYLQNSTKQLQKMDHGNNEPNSYGTECKQKASSDRQNQTEDYHSHKHFISKGEEERQDSKDVPKMQKRKSMLDDMKNVESKVIISDMHINFEDEQVAHNDGTMIDIMDDRNFISHNRFPEGTVAAPQFKPKEQRLSISYQADLLHPSGEKIQQGIDQASQKYGFSEKSSSNKQVVMSYMTMQNEHRGANKVDSQILYNNQSFNPNSYWSGIQNHPSQHPVLNRARSNESIGFSSHGSQGQIYRSSNPHINVLPAPFSQVQQSDYQSNGSSNLKSTSIIHNNPNYSLQNSMDNSSKATMSFNNPSIGFNMQPISSKNIKPVPPALKPVSTRVIASPDGMPSSKNFGSSTKVRFVEPASYHSAQKQGGSSANHSSNLLNNFSFSNHNQSFKSSEQPEYSQSENAPPGYYDYIKKLGFTPPQKFTSNSTNKPQKSGSSFRTNKVDSEYPSYQPNKFQKTIDNRFESPKFSEIWASKLSPQTSVISESSHPMANQDSVKMLRDQSSYSSVKDINALQQPSNNSIKKSGSQKSIGRSSLDRKSRSGSRLSIEYQNKVEPFLMLGGNSSHHTNTDRTQQLNSSKQISSKGIKLYS